MIKLNLGKSFSVIRSLSTFYLLIFILIFGITFIYSEIIHESKLFFHYFKHYVISISGIIFWIIVIFLKDETKKIIVLIFTSISIAIILIEILSFFYVSYIKSKNIFINDLDSSTKKFDSKTKKDSNDLIIEGFDSTTKEYDSRTRKEVYDDFNKKNIEAVVVIQPSKHYGEISDINYTVYPLSGISKKTTIFCNESGKYSIYESDRYGFNNPDIVWEKELVDYMLVGDSFVHGACVDPGDDIAGKIRKKNNLNAINLGMAGNNPLFNLAVLKEYAVKKKPKRVLWFYFEGNDINEMRTLKDNIILKKYMNTDFTQNLINKQDEIDKVLFEVLQKEIQIYYRMMIMKEEKVNQKKNKISSILRLANMRYLIRFDDFFNLEDKTIITKEEVKIFEKTILESKNLVEKWGGEFYFVYLPEFIRYKNYYRNKNYKKIINIVKSNGIPLINIHSEVFVKQKNKLALFPSVRNIQSDLHYNAVGYELISDKIIDLTIK